jgi:hypothetical protein
MGTGYGIRDPGSEIRDLRSGIRDPGSEIRDPRSGIRDPGSEIRDPEKDPGSRGQKGTGSGSATLDAEIISVVDRDPLGFQEPDADPVL